MFFSVTRTTPLLTSKARSGFRNKKNYVTESTAAMYEISDLLKSQASTAAKRQPIKDIVSEIDAIPNIHDQHARLTEILNNEISIFREQKVNVNVQQAKSEYLTDIKRIDDELETQYIKQQARMEKMDKLFKNGAKPVDWTELANKNYHPWDNVEFIKQMTEEEDAVKRQQLEIVDKKFETGRNELVEWATQMEESDRVTQRVSRDIVKKLEKNFEEVEDLEQGFHLFTYDDLANRFPHLDAEIDEELRNWDFGEPKKLGDIGHYED